MLCQNNVAVLEPVNNTHLYACGTMAYSPVCTYVRKDVSIFCHVKTVLTFCDLIHPFVSFIY